MVVGGERESKPDRGSIARGGAVLRTPDRRYSAPVEEPLPQPVSRPASLEEWNARMASAIGQSIPMRIEEVSKERVVMTMPVDARVHQPWGILHGGASLVLAESAASIGAGLNCPPGMRAVGQEINANHLRPKRDGVVRAVAEPLHVGRTSQVWSVEIRDEAGKLVCISRCTLAVIPAPD
jgi:1,4-dihydroxy-2-naphthoyl-CoA hydrolase